MSCHGKGLKMCKNFRFTKRGAASCFSNAESEFIQAGEVGLVCPRCAAFLLSDSYSLNTPHLHLLTTMRAMSTSFLCFPISF